MKAAWAKLRGAAMRMSMRPWRRHGNELATLFGRRQGTLP